MPPAIASASASCGKEALRDPHGRRAHRFQVRILRASRADTVQLMGVWTHPAYRRRGLSRELLREVCGHLSQGETVTLFVNDFNRPAIASTNRSGSNRSA